MVEKQKLGPNQQAWIDALRSGKYQQTRGALHKADGFCCLGVGCDITGVLWSDGLDERNRYLLLEYDMEWESLPSKFIELYGFHTNATNGQDTPLERLIALNDTDRLSFTKIADIIEANPSEYFKEPR